MTFDFQDFRCQVAVALETIETAARSQIGDEKRSVRAEGDAVGFEVEIGVAGQDALHAAVRGQPGNAAVPVGAV